MLRLLRFLPIDPDETDKRRDVVKRLEEHGFICKFRELGIDVYVYDSIPFVNRIFSSQTVLFGVGVVIAVITILIVIGG